MASPDKPSGSGGNFPSSGVESALRSTTVVTPSVPDTFELSLSDYTPPANNNEPAYAIGLGESPTPLKPQTAKKDKDSDSQEIDVQLNGNVSFELQDLQTFSLPEHVGEYDILMPMPSVDRLIHSELPDVRVEIAVRKPIAKALIQSAKLIDSSQYLTALSSAGSQPSSPLGSPSSEKSQPSKATTLAQEPPDFVLSSADEPLPDFGRPVLTVPPPSVRKPRPDRTGKPPSSAGDVSQRAAPISAGGELPSTAESASSVSQPSSYADQVIDQLVAKQRRSSKTAKVDVQMETSPAAALGPVQSDAEAQVWTRLFNWGMQALMNALEQVKERKHANTIVINVSMPNLQEKAPEHLLILRAHLMPHNPLIIYEKKLLAPPYETIERVRKVGEGRFVNEKLYNDSLTRKVTQIVVKKETKETSEVNSTTPANGADADADATAAAAAAVAVDSSKSDTSNSVSDQPQLGTLVGSSSMPAAPLSDVEVNPSVTSADANRVVKFDPVPKVHVVSKYDDSSLWYQGLTDRVTYPLQELSSDELTSRRLLTESSSPTSALTSQMTVSSTSTFGSSPAKLTSTTDLELSTNEQSPSTVTGSSGMVRVSDYQETHEYHARAAVWQRNGAPSELPGDFVRKMMYPVPAVAIRIGVASPPLANSIERVYVDKRGLVNRLQARKRTGTS